MSATASASSALPSSTAHVHPDYKKDIGEAFEGIAVLFAIAAIRGMFLLPALFYNWNRPRADVHQRDRSPAPPRQRDVGAQPKLFDITGVPQRRQLASWDAIVPVSARVMSPRADTAPARPPTPLPRAHPFQPARLRSFARGHSAAPPADANVPSSGAVEVAVAIAMPARARSASGRARMPEYALGLAQLPLRTQVLQDRAGDDIAC